MQEEWQLQVMIGVGWREGGKEIRRIVLDQESVRSKEELCQMK